MWIRKELVISLFEVLPDDIKYINMLFPEVQFGYVRYDGEKYDSIYLKDIYIGNVHAILKFNYVDGLYVFSRIYLCDDNSNEYGYDKDLKLDTVYLKGETILDYDNEEERKHVANVIEEWKATNKYLESIGNDFLSVYQIMKKGEFVKKAYLVCADKLKKDNRYDVLEHVVEGLDIDNCGWFCKCKINTNKVSKSNKIYLMIE